MEQSTENGTALFSIAKSALEAEIRAFQRLRRTMDVARNGVFMRRNRKVQPQEVMPTINPESPAILRLIEQLERDLKESESKGIKTQ